MANSKISALTSATTPLAGTETLPIVQSSTTKQVSVANLTTGRAVNVLSLSAAGNITSSAGNLSVTKAGSNPASAGALAGISAGFDNNLEIGWVQSTRNSASEPRVLQLNPLGSDVNFYANIIPSTAAKGVNFTSNTPLAGMTSQLLNWYEEGTWTPNQGAGLTVVGAFSSTGKYTRIGRQINVTGTVSGATSVAAAAANVICTNLPLTVLAGSSGVGSTTINALTSGGQCYANQTTTNLYSTQAIAATSTIYFTVTYFV